MVALKAVGAAGLLLVALVIVARAVRRWRPSSADAVVTNEERDSVFDGRLLMRVWLEWLRRLFGRRARLGPDRLAAPAPVMVDSEPTLSVRALYRRVLSLGESAGARRAIATTALEHLPTLQQCLEPAEGLTGLTDAYLRARYAEIDSSPEEIAELRHGVDRLRGKFGAE